MLFCLRTENSQNLSLEGRVRETKSGLRADLSECKLWSQCSKTETQPPSISFVPSMASWVSTSSPFQEFSFSICHKHLKRLHQNGFKVPSFDVIFFLPPRKAFPLTFSSRAAASKPGELLKDADSLGSSTDLLNPPLQEEGPRYQCFQRLLGYCLVAQWLGLHTFTVRVWV